MITALLLLLLRCLLLLTSMTLRVRQRPFLRRPTQFSLIPSPHRLSLRLSLRLLLSLSVILLSTIAVMSMNCLKTLS